MSNGDHHKTGRPSVGVGIAAAVVALGIAACQRQVSTHRMSGDGDGDDGGVPIEEAATGASGSTASSGATSGAGGGANVATWADASETAFTCEQHTATAVGDGRVLIVGACTIGDEEVAAAMYDLSTKSFAALAPVEPRVGHAAMGLSEGRVALVGGAQDVEVFDPATNAFTVIGPLAMPRSEPMVVALPSGALWVLGGVGEDGLALASTEFVDVATGATFAGPSMQRGRYRAAALPISGGGVWVVGGESTDAEGSAEALDSTEWSGCGGCDFEPAGTIPGVGGAVAGIGIGGAFCDGTVDTGTVVFGSYALAWRGGGGFEAAVDLPNELLLPAATRTPTGRFVAAGGAIYANETRVLEATPGGGAKLVATRVGNGGWATITPLGGDDLLVVSGDAAVLTLP